MGNFTSEDTAAYSAHYSVPRRDSTYQTIKNIEKKQRKPSSLKRSTAGIWVARSFNSETPLSRTGHCTIPVPHLGRVYICYGAREDETLLNDFWYLDTKTNAWTQLNVDPQLVDPRVGAHAVLIGEEIWVFGGTDDEKFFGDLHCINIHNGSVRRPETSGDGPSPRTNHVMAFNGSKLLIYSGVDATILTDLYLLDIETMVWSKVELSHGRSQAAYAICDSKLYVYGASSAPGFLVFDFTNNDAINIKGTGVIPPNTITCASLINIDEYLVLIGGEVHNEMERASHCTPTYAFNTKTQQWSVIPMQPDNDTTSAGDGSVDRNGGFMITAYRDPSVVYDSAHREILIFLGSPSGHPPTLHAIKMTAVLATLHIRSDMINMLK